MKQLKHIKKHLDWEQYYNPEYNWSKRGIPNKYVNDFEFIKEFHRYIPFYYFFNLYDIKLSVLEKILESDFQIALFVPAIEIQTAPANNMAKLNLAKDFINIIFDSQKITREFFEKYKHYLINLKNTRNKIEFDLHWGYMIKKNKWMQDLTFLQENADLFFDDTFPWRGFSHTHFFKKNKEFFKQFKK